MSILTLYFAGSGHSLRNSDATDSIAAAFRHTRNACVFFPGPGGADTSVHHKNFDWGSGNQFVKDNKSAWDFKSRRALTGQGWHKMTFSALQYIAHFLLKSPGNVTINIGAHSRGSITAMMLINDVLLEHLPKGSTHEYKIIDRTNSSKTYAGDEARGAGGDFIHWYRKKVGAIYKEHCGLDNAEKAITLMHYIAGEKDRLRFNMFLFDPVAGGFQANDSRKQGIPNSSSLGMCRVLRMEEGGCAGKLSEGMPEFTGYSLLDSSRNRNLMIHEDGERFVIPLPGSHGSGVDENGGRTTGNKYIGTSYMVALLDAGGTVFNESWLDGWCDRDKMLKYYEDIYRRALGQRPEGLRANFMVHKRKEADGAWSYPNEAVNADHNFLKRKSRACVGEK